MTDVLPLPWCMDPELLAAAYVESSVRSVFNTTLVTRETGTGVSLDFRFYGMPENQRLLVEAFPEATDNQWMVSVWPLPLASLADRGIPLHQDLAALTIRMTTEPHQVVVSPANARKRQIDLVGRKGFFGSADADEIEATRGAWLLCDVITEAVDMIARRLPYVQTHVLVPGVVLKKITYNRSATGLWHGHKFVLQASGRRAYLRVWALPGATETTKPSWESCVELSQPLPFFQQLPTSDHNLALVTALALCSDVLAPAAGQPVLPVPDLTVPATAAIAKILDRVTVLSTTFPATGSAA
jgi:hypothetical protein